MKKSKRIILGLSFLFLLVVSFFLGNIYGRYFSGDFPMATKMTIIESLIERYYLFGINKEDQKIGAIEGYVKALGDPYTEYLDQEEYEALNQSTEGEYAGVGLVVSPSDNGMIEVVSPIKGGPAADKDIKAGDIILKINGKEYNGETMSDAVKVMKGEVGTDVTITFSRKEKDQTRVFDETLTRAMISLTTVESEMIGDIGYINISQFERKTGKEFIDAFESLKGKSKGIIIDLRYNPGGLLDSTVEIADYLLPEGPIVKTVDKNGKETVEKSASSEQNIPMVVLVNKSSASASEILTGALKDYGKATIIGENTFGKGIVQSVIPLESKDALKVTISEYFSPKGNKIHKKGVAPDIKVDLKEDVKIIGPKNLKEDAQLEKALEVLENK
ncbi:MAG: S41 family peptidase [Finegoldia sp.]|nr:S41 family peptidase [Finegoldia sp.]